jgi:hypothetical protein
LKSHHKRRYSNDEYTHKFFSVLWVIREVKLNPQRNTTTDASGWLKCKKVKYQVLTMMNILEWSYTANRKISQ